MTQSQTALRFWGWLENELKRKGWRAADLTRASGVPSGTLSNIKKGNFAPGVDLCATIANALGVPIENAYRAAGIPVSESAPCTQLPMSYWELVQDIKQLPEEKVQTAKDFIGWLIATRN